MPANNIITGIAIRYFSGPAPRPTMAPQAWTLCTNGIVGWGLTGSAPGITTNVTFPTPSVGTRTYLAISLLFDGQVPTTNAREEALSFGETDFVGGYTQAVFAPTPAGLFARSDARVTGGQVTVDWTTNVEGAVASYEICYSVNKKDGLWTETASAATRPKGDNSSYSASFDRPVRGQQVYYRIKGCMTDGTEQWSQTMRAKK